LGLLLSELPSKAMFVGRRIIFFDDIFRAEFRNAEGREGGKNKVIDVNNKERRKKR
jgi:hypothetical protein